ncbi:MAG: hypothetical protein COB76_01745 [Alphaproteobacteria bacterium]|nr:MAG: hypothetical protein COB76_01745 [Alphaproteobacteria bacterium]
MLKIAATSDTDIFRRATAPVIFICEDKAKSYSALIDYIRKSVPKVPIVAENERAYQLLKSGPFASHCFNRHADKNGDPLISADVIAVIGTPKEMPEILRQKKIISKPNFAEISPPALHKLKGLEKPWAAEHLNDNDRNDPKKVRQAERFRQDRLKSADDLRKSLIRKGYTPL